MRLIADNVSKQYGRDRWGLREQTAEFITGVIAPARTQWRGQVHPDEDPRDRHETDERYTTAAIPVGSVMPVR